MQQFEFENRDEFTSFVLTETKNEDSLILGGHYYLIFNNTTNKLEPAIFKNTNSFTDKSNIILSGNFPLESLDIALSVFIQKQKRKELAKISLLVNDHLFQSKALRFLIFNEKNQNWGLLREKYYKNSQIPRQFTEKLKSFGLNQEEVLLKNYNHKSRFFHPFLFSETSLRKKFDKTLKRKLSNLDSFLLKKKTNNKSELYFVDSKKNSFCLTDGGLCGCSGEVMQLLYEVHLLNYSSLILLVPNDCFESVCKGVKAFIAFIRENKSFAKLSSFIIAAGFGENDFIFKDKKEKIRVIHYIN